MGSTSADIGRAICKVFEQTHVDSRKEYLPGFSKMDNVFVFTRWDWSELETIFKPLESFPPSKIGDLQYVRVIGIARRTPKQILPHSRALPSSPLHYPFFPTSHLFSFFSF
jgi:hypothetical protein